MAKRRTHEDFVNEMKDAHGDSYTVLGEFVNTNTTVSIKHNVCGHEWSPYPLNILKKSGCPNCKKKKLAKAFKLSLDDVKVVVEKRGYNLVSNFYNNAHDVLDFTCPDGHPFSMKFNNFQQGQNCPECAPKERSSKQRRPLNEVVRAIEENGFEIVEWIDEYESGKSTFVIRCSNNHFSKKSVLSFMKYKSCPHCTKTSKAEVDIVNFLESNNILYEQQYRFDECKFKRALPFDFAILKEDGSIKMLIEYDGRQHFEPVDKFGGIVGYKKTKINDMIKDKFCEKNGIKLLRIPHTKQKSINRILVKELM